MKWWLWCLLWAWSNSSVAICLISVYSERWQEQRGGQTMGPRWLSLVLMSIHCLRKQGWCWSRKNRPLWTRRGNKRLWWQPMHMEQSVFMFFTYSSLVHAFEFMGRKVCVIEFQDPPYSKKFAQKEGSNQAKRTSRGYQRIVLPC